MSTHSNQRVLPIHDATDDLVTFCKTEPRAVRISLELALSRGWDMQRVSLACGWKGKPAALCRIASDHSKASMPESRVDRFCLATGTNLLRQVKHRIELERHLAGKETERDRTAAMVRAELASWRAAA